MHIDKNRHREILNITIEEGNPCSVDWSPDGTRLVIGDNKGGVWVFTRDGKLLWQCKEHTYSVYGVSWSPDGRRIASASEDKTIRVYNTNSGKIMLRGEAALRNWGVTWSPDSKHLAWCVEERKRYIVRIFDASTGRPEIDCDGHTSIVWKVSWSPCGSKLASGSYDQTLRIWDTGNGSCLHCLKGNDSDILSICWSPDGQKLASVSNTIVQVWETLTGKCLFICNGHRNMVWSVAWSPKGNILATGSGDRTVRLWDGEKGTELLQIGNQGHTGVSFSPCGNVLTSLVSNTIQLFDVSDLVLIKKAAASEIQFLRYIAKQAVTIGIGPPAVEVKPPWVPHLPEAEGDCLGALRYPNKSGYSPSVAIFPDGLSIATGHSDGTVRRWDLRTGAILWQGTEMHIGLIKDIAVSPDGALIATASEDKTIRIWDAVTGKCLRQLTGHKYTVVELRWSPEGKRLASIEYFSYENQLRTWDAKTGDCLWISEGHFGYTSSLDWSKDGHFIATGDNLGNIMIWDALSGKNLRRLNNNNNDIWNLCWSPDSRFFIVAYSRFKLLVMNSQDGSVRYHLKGHTGGVSVLDWSRDGRFIATGARNEDKTVRVWNADTGLELKRFTFAEKGCYRLAFSPDSAFIVSSHYIEKGETGEDVFRIWDTRGLLEHHTDQTATAPTPSPPFNNKLLPDHLRLLPAALAQMHRLHIFPPLSLVRDILDLLANRCEEESLKALLATSTGIQGLRDLHWPFAARIGLAALLLHRLPSSEWQPPENTTPTQIRDALIMALSGDSIKSEPPAPPVSLLTKSAELVDDRLLTLLAMLGPEAVAADPGLPLRLLPRVKEIPALSISQRRQLGIRTGTPHMSGHSTGLAPGADRGQIGDIQMGPLREDFTSLLPSQLALPPLVKMYRHLRNELLFRSREMAEPPRLRPAVIFLDVSPPTFGPVEQITRLAAFTIGQSLRRAGQRVILLTNSDGIKEGQWLLELNHPADLVETWLQRTLKTVPATRGLELARVLRAGLQENDGLEPIILVLSHPWFGAEEEIPEIKNLRGLFVQYPGSHCMPVLAPRCAKYHSIESTQFNELTSALAQLIT